VVNARMVPAHTRVENARTGYAYRLPDPLLPNGEVGAAHAEGDAWTSAAYVHTNAGNDLSAPVEAERHRNVPLLRTPAANNRRVGYRLSVTGGH
jgi:hypothetical protein